MTLPSSTAEPEGPSSRDAPQAPSLCFLPLLMPGMANDVPIEQLERAPVMQMCSSEFAKGVEGAKGVKAWKSGDRLKSGTSSLGHCLISLFSSSPLLRYGMA